MYNSLPLLFCLVSFICVSLKTELLGREFCVRKVKVLNFRGYQLQLDGSPVGGPFNGLE